MDEYLTIFTIFSSDNVGLLQNKFYLSLILSFVLIQE